MTNFIFLSSLFLSHENSYLQSIPFCLRVILPDLDKYSFLTWCSHFYSPFVSCLMKSFDAMNFPLITSSVVVQSPSPTLCNPMDCSLPGLPVPHHLPKFAQVHVHFFGDAIQPSHPLMPYFLLPLIFPSIKDFSNDVSVCIRWPKYWSSTSASVLPVDIQGWSPIRLTGLIPLPSKGLSGDFSSTWVL